MVEEAKGQFILLPFTLYAKGKSALLKPGYYLAGGERQESHFASVLCCRCQLQALLRGSTGDARGTERAEGRV